MDFSAASSEHIRDPEHQGWREHGQVTASYSLPADQSLLLLLLARDDSLSELCKTLLNANLFVHIT